MDQTFLSVSDASKFSAYHTDYLTQMCRKGALRCKQISKVWFVSLQSLEQYLKQQNKTAQTDAKHIKDRSVRIRESISGDSAFFIDTEKYIDSKQASKISSYNRDYLTQLARSGDIIAKKIGKVWFFEESSLKEHLRRLKRHTGKSSNSDSNSPTVFNRLSEKTPKQLFSYEKDTQEEMLPQVSRKERVEIRKLKEIDTPGKSHIHHHSIVNTVRAETQRSRRINENVLSDKSSAVLQEYNQHVNKEKGKTHQNEIPTQTATQPSDSMSVASDSTINRVKNPDQKLVSTYKKSVNRRVIYRKLEIDLSDNVLIKDISEGEKSYKVNFPNSKRKQHSDIKQKSIYHKHKTQNRMRHHRGDMVVMGYIIDNLSVVFIFLSLLLLLYINLLSIGVFDAPYRSFVVY